MTRSLAIIPEAVNIVAPLISPKAFESNPIRITQDSPKQYRKAVYEIARFFRREFRYDFVQYGHNGEDNDPEGVAFLWLHPEVSSLCMESYRLPCVGATCFRYRRYDDHPEGYAMQWIWIHPFFRRRGLLTRSWGPFKKEFGDFVCERPLSEQMNNFLNKQKRIQSAFTDSEDESDARKILEWLKKEKLETFGLYDVRRKFRTDFKDKDKALEALAVLCDCDYIAEKPPKPGKVGRKKIEYMVNPLINNQ